MRRESETEAEAEEETDQVRSHCKLNIKCPADCRSLCHAAGQQRCRHRSAFAGPGKVSTSLRHFRNAFPDSKRIFRVTGGKV